MHRILIIEDSLYQRENLKSLLLDFPLEIETAESGEAGLQLIRSQSFDCVLLDLIMPGLNGLEVLKCLQGEGLNVPVIIITSDVQDSTKRECLALGSAAVIHKPTNKRYLTDILKRIFNERNEA